MYAVLLPVFAAALVPLAFRFHRYKVRVGAVRRVRSEISDWMLDLARSGYPQTPVGGMSAPRIVPPTGPEQTDDARGCGVDFPPTADSAAPNVVRPRSRVVLGDPRLLSTTLASRSGS